MPGTLHTLHDVELGCVLVDIGAGLP